MLNKYTIHLLILIFPLLNTSCSRAINARDAYIRPYHMGHFEAAHANVTKLINQPKNSDDAVWLLLDRATINFASGNVEQAIADYQLAIDVIDLYTQNCSAETLGKAILQDELGAYAGEDFEQILARIYFALALHYDGDDNNAYALLKQAENIQQEKREMYKECKLTQDYRLIDNALAKYLLAAMSEKKGDTSNAKVLYDQYSQLTGKRVKPFDPSLATVIFLCHSGNAPYKISITSSPSIASTAALDTLAMPKRRLRLSSLGGIPTPALTYWLQENLDQAFINFDGQYLPLQTCYNIDKASHKQLKQKIPNIVARGVARHIIRYGAVQAASKCDPLAGSIADIAVFIANRMTKADTRTWTTLPKTLDMARLDTKPGIHDVTISIGAINYPLTLDLKPRDLCLIHIFNIHPGVATLLVPDRFLKGEDI